MQGLSLSMRMTTDPVWISFLLECHFWRFCSSLKYSSCHRFQKSWRAFVINLQIESRLSGTERRFSSGRSLSLRPIKISDGANATVSLGSLDMEQSGLEFKSASISAASVVISSKVSSWAPKSRLKWCLNDFTPAEMGWCRRVEMPSYISLNSKTINLVLKLILTEQIVYFSQLIIRAKKI